MPPGFVDAGKIAAGKSSSWGTYVRCGIVFLVFLALIRIGAAYPYIGRRLLMMIPTLVITSIVIFTVVQLPPGDFIETRIMQLEESGDSQEIEGEIERLRELFHLDESMAKRYTRWLGLHWFFTYAKADTGLLQGDMGTSMETTRKVNTLIGDRILLTFLISLGTMIFTWTIALPIGIYSAVRQYSIADYVLTFIGFIGMCVPGFLLALVLMTLGGVSGLFSSEYATRPEWSFGKVVDLLKHIWIPITVMGVTGTAGMIRIMRGNLLDELRKPYVITARAKGVRPLKLLFKYPVRIALNPFISGIGGIFPRLVSGGAIIAIVLSLPTIGPLMLAAVMTEDVYLAGSQLMLLSLLGILGVLVSDLLLLTIDPRIRFKAGKR
jgi:ABC-type dipeptide/oligopeptide/nickel transport system permease component